MKKLSALVVAGIAVSASAQVATYTWQVSLDGVSWSSSAPAIGATVHVRLLAGWSGITGTDVAYAGGQFDATLVGGTAASTVSNILRPSPFAFSAQTLVASSFSGGIKIDTAADVALPGAGTGWVNPGQVSKIFAAPGTYNTDNPAVVFSYDVVGNDFMSVGMVLNQATGRSMAIYVTESGTQTRINASATIINTAIIGFPTPGSLSLLGMSGIVAARRRR